MDMRVNYRRGIFKRYRVRRANLGWMRKMHHLSAEAFWSHPMVMSILRPKSFRVPSLKELLILDRVDPNIAPFGCSLLRSAVKAGNMDDVLMLVCCGAYVDEDTFHTAIQIGNIKITLFLMRCRKKIRISDSERIFIDLVATWSNVGRRLGEDAQAAAFLDFVKRFPKIFQADVAFLAYFINASDFSAPNWLKCFRGMLELPNAAQLVQNQPHQDFHDLMDVFLEKSIKGPDRMGLLHSWISLGGRFNITNINLAIYFWGFNDEVDVMVHFLYNTSLCCMRLFPLTTLVLGLEGNHRPQDALVSFLIFWYTNMIPDLIAFSRRQVWFDAKRVILQALRFMAATPLVRDLLKFHFRNTVLDCPEVHETIAAMPRVPSLVELSRNATRRAVRSTQVIASPGEFQNALKKLDAPQVVKDILRFKRPLYASCYC